MKKILILITVVILTLSMFGCSDSSSKPDATEKDINISSKLENMVELQKNVFIAKVLSVSEKQALIPKYNVDITDYTVYTVDVTESLDGYTPLGEIQLYCVGTGSEFGDRISLKKNESYVIDTEMWIYDSKIIYLLPIFTKAYPRIDAAGRVTIAQSDTKATDCGTLEDYKQSYYDAKMTVESKNQGFFEASKVLERFTEIFRNIKETNDKNWLRDFEYEWIPSDELIEKTRKYSDEIYNKITALSNSADIENSLKEIFK